MAPTTLRRCTPPTRVSSLHRCQRTPSSRFGGSTANHEREGNQRQYKKWFYDLRSSTPETQRNGIPAGKTILHFGRSRVSVVRVRDQPRCVQLLRPSRSPHQSPTLSCRTRRNGMSQYHTLRTYDHSKTANQHVKCEVKRELGELADDEYDDATLALPVA